MRPSLGADSEHPALGSICSANTWSRIRHDLFGNGIGWQSFGESLRKKRGLPGTDHLQSHGVFGLFDAAIRWDA